jgi:uncharacterized membrane protein (UPF0182 family)
VWQVPDAPAAKAGKAAPPYYMSLRMPQSSARSYCLTTTLTEGGSSDASAFMAVDADAASPGYGTIRLLEMPAGAGVDGPKAVQAKIDAAGKKAAKSGELPHAGADSTVEYGNLLTVPLDGGLLYVEPVYVHGADGGFPRLGAVAALYHGRTSFQPTLMGALDALFPSTAAPPGSSGDGSALRQALADEQKALDDSQAAMKRGDRAAYRVAQKQLADALKKAQAAAASSAPAAPAHPVATPAPTTAAPGGGKRS